MLKHTERIHAESRGTYGWPRVHAELTLGLGMVVNHKRVARLMREAGIQGLYWRRRRGCTVRDLHAEPYVDLVDRDFVVDGPDEIWCTDVTEHPTAAANFRSIDCHSTRSDRRMNRLGGRGRVRRATSYST